MDTDPKDAIEVLKPFLTFGVGELAKLTIKDLHEAAKEKAFGKDRTPLVDLESDAEAAALLAELKKIQQKRPTGPIPFANLLSTSR